MPFRVRYCVIPGNDCYRAVYISAKVEPEETAMLAVLSWMRGYMDDALGKKGDMSGWSFTCFYVGRLSRAQPLVCVFRKQASGKDCHGSDAT